MWKRCELIRRYGSSPPAKRTARDETENSSPASGACRTERAQRAAEHAVAYVRSGMIVGLGGGSTAPFAMGQSRVAVNERRSQPFGGGPRASFRIRRITHQRILIHQS